MLSYAPFIAVHGGFFELVGFLQDKKGPRCAALWGTALLCGGFFAAAFLPGWAGWGFFLAFSIPAGLGTAFLYPSIQSCAQKWYAGRKGLATGVIGGAVGLSGAFLTLFVRAALRGFGPVQGIRGAFWALGAITLPVCLAGSLLLQDPPELAEPAAETENPSEPAAPAAPTVPARPYQIPSIDFLQNGVSRAGDPAVDQEMKEKAGILVDTLKSFGVTVRITGIFRGPSVTRYEIQPAAGIKVSKITGLADDNALSLAAQGVRIEAPIPGKPAIGIEVPNSHKDTVSLREILESDSFRSSKSKLAFAVGRDIAGNAVIGDIARLPHMIIAGATGSGKSVCTNSIIMSILYHGTPEEGMLILIDP